MNNTRDKTWSVGAEPLPAFTFVTFWRGRHQLSGSHRTRTSKQDEQKRENNKRKRGERGKARERSSIRMINVYDMDILLICNQLEAPLLQLWALMQDLIGTGMSVNFNADCSEGKKSGVSGHKIIVHPTLKVHIVQEQKRLKRINLSVGRDEKSVNAFGRRWMIYGEI